MQQVYYVTFSLNCRSCFAGPFVLRASWYHNLSVNTLLYLRVNPTPPVGRLQAYLPPLPPYPLVLPSYPPLGSVQSLPPTPLPPYPPIPLSPYPRIPLSPSGQPRPAVRGYTV